MINAISSIGFGSQQTCLQKTKSLGFGVSYLDGGDYNEVHLSKKQTPVAPPRTKAICIDAEPETPANRFEAQVLANQQKMLGLLGEIKKNTAPKNSYEGISNIR